jgi:uncharacterized protein involved in exopolysaccharide biosynthesis
VTPNSQHQNTLGGSGYDDEISLIDLWLVLVRRKLWIISVFLLCLVLGSVYAFTRPLRYEYRTGIEQARTAHMMEGRISGTFNLLVPVQHSLDLLEKIIIPENEKAIYGELGDGPKTEVETDKGSYILTLATVSAQESVDRLQKLHQAVAAAFAKEQDKELKNALALQVNPLRARVEILRGQIQTFEEELRNLSKTDREDSAIREFIVSQQIGELRREMAQTRLDLVDAESSAKAILDANQGSRILYLAVQSKSPIGTSKQLIIALSVVLGAMLGIMGAFMAEFFGKVAEASQQGKEGK